MKNMYLYLQKLKRIAKDYDELSNLWVNALDHQWKIRNLTLAVKALEAMEYSMEEELCLIAQT